MSCQSSGNLRSVNNHFKRQKQSSPSLTMAHNDTMSLMEVEETRNPWDSNIRGSDPGALHHHPHPEVIYRKLYRSLVWQIKEAQKSPNGGKRTTNPRAAYIMRAAHTARTQLLTCPQPHPDLEQSQYRRLYAALLRYIRKTERQNLEKQMDARVMRR